MSLTDLPLPYSLSATRPRRGIVTLEGVGDDRLLLSGVSNHDVPAQGFADSIAGSDEAQFVQTASDVIWLAAYAANNARSDYHWQASACYYEAQRRGNPDLYQQAYDKARASTGL